MFYNHQFLQYGRMKIILMSLGFTIFCSTIFSQEKGTLIDLRDGRIYKTVKVGDQWIMAENLAYKAVIGCWAYNNDDSSVKKYGYLYNWETAKNVCPAGWHLPTDTEWTRLINNLGGEKIAGSKMKATTDWKYDVNSYTTNSSGFNALPAGRYESKRNLFSHFGESTSFWSGTPSNNNEALSRGLHYDREEVHSGKNNYTYGFSVRCIKD
jgi:uncharacterized protein (TIGR02145 family)